MTKEVQKRGEVEHGALYYAIQEAADRHAHYPDNYCNLPIKWFFDKIKEETDESYEAVLAGDEQRMHEEIGDLGRVVAMLYRRVILWQHENGGSTTSERG